MATLRQMAPPMFQEGERMSRDEFLRRWEMLPDLKFAQLLEGEVYLASPLSIGHGELDFCVGGWLAHYVAATPGCRGMHGATWLMQQDAPQPDLAVRILPEYGGQSRSEGVLSAGAPELITEISVTSKRRDLGPKMRLYRDAGVSEYIIVDAIGSEVIWRRLVNGEYQPIAPDAERITKSSVLPGLWLYARALLDQDYAKLIQVVERGLKSPEHRDFVEMLARRKRAD